MDSCRRRQCDEYCLWNEHRIRFETFENSISINSGANNKSMWDVVWWAFNVHIGCVQDTSGCAKCITFFLLLAFYNRKIECGDTHVFSFALSLLASEFFPHWSWHIKNAFWQLAFSFSLSGCHFAYSNAFFVASERFNGKTLVQIPTASQIWFHCRLLNCIMCIRTHLQL